VSFMASSPLSSILSNFPDQPNAESVTCMCILISLTLLPCYFFATETIRPQR
jgi:hypothetical protein